jgi:hypothetical protein
VAEGSGTDGTVSGVAEWAPSSVRPLALEPLLPLPTTAATTAAPAVAMAAATIVSRRTARDARSRRSIARRHASKLSLVPSTPTRM